MLTFIKGLGKYSPDWPTFANLVCSDSPDSPTFANLFCSDSPDSLTFAKGHFWKKCDSPRHICTSNERVSQIWGEWPLLKFFTIFVPSFDPNDWCLKNGLHSGSLNPGPLGHESSALTTRPRLLKVKWMWSVDKVNWWINSENDISDWFTLLASAYIAKTFQTPLNACTLSCSILIAGFCNVLDSKQLLL